jgi:hypothetical protein
MLLGTSAAVVAMADQGRSAGNPVNQLIEQFVGLEIYGGCESCDAYQTVTARGPGVFVLTVHHDERCPQQKSREGRL